MAKNYYNMVSWIKFLVDTATSLNDIIYIRKIIAQFENVLLNDNNVDVTNFRYAVNTINSDINECHNNLIKQYTVEYNMECVEC